MNINNILCTVFAVQFLLPVSNVVAENSVSSQISLSQKQLILETVGPSLKATANFIAQTKPARDIDELQAQIKSLLDGGETKPLYQAANAKLDKLATISLLKGPEEIPNFEEVIPGIYRSATPTLSQVESLVATKKIDQVISLNPELKMLAKMDPGTTAPLTADRRQAIINALVARGKKGERTETLLKLYEDHLTYAQAVYKKSRSYIDAFPLDGPDETLAEYFAVLQRILELRETRKNVLFHCNIGKHRTGLMSLLVESLDRKATPTEADLNELYLNFIQRNWNEQAQTRIHYLIPLPLIVRSEPFKKLVLRWKTMGV